MTVHEKWFISDTHFFHANMLKFVDENGVRIRQFNSLDDMHNTIVKNWNKMVAPNDYVYHLGDVTFQYHRPFQELMWSLNGDKRLIVGNHDKLKQEGLTKHFSKIMLWHGFKEFDFTASHMPLRERSFRDGRYNGHGHTHNNDVEGPYINLCVEAIKYTPVHIETIRDIIRERDKKLNT